MSTPDFDVKGLADYLAQVDEKLKSEAPQYIEGVARMLQAHGKRLRPCLVIAIAYHSGKEIDETVIHAAAAVELVHIASLIHDDLMDDGTLRWNQPTINAQEGADAAILAGDYLLAKGCALAARVSAAAAEELADAIAVLCEGQANELRSQYNLNRTTEELISAIRGKTSRMFSAACTLGGLVAGMDSTQIQHLTAFADAVGIAFQYSDDIQDFVQSPEAAGKSVGNDIHEGKYTLPTILSLQGPHGAQLAELLKQKAPVSEVVKILEADGSLVASAKEAERYRQQASAQLDQLDNQALADTLRRASHAF